VSCKKSVVRTRQRSRRQYGRYGLLRFNAMNAQQIPPSSMPARLPAQAPPDPKVQADMHLDCQSCNEKHAICRLNGVLSANRLGIPKKNRFSFVEVMAMCSLNKKTGTDLF